MSSLRRTAARLMAFFETGIWRIRLDDLPAPRAAALRLLRILVLATQRFAKGRGALRASALTFYSLLSIVPVAALAFAVAKGFGVEKLLEKELYVQLSGHEEIVSRIIGFAGSLLENTRGGLIAGIGMALLLWAVVKLLGQIETSFNAVWGVAKQRTPVRKFSDYLSITLISPLLVALSSSATVFVTTRVTEITERLPLLDIFSRAILLSLKLIPYGLVWILFTVLYMLMPNTRVRFSAGAFAGIFTGTVFQAVQWVYITFQVGTSRYNAIYGSFAALPLFLIWLQLSWMITLFGAEISFAAQNAAAYEFEPDARRISPAYRRLITLEICRRVVHRFAAGQPALDARGVAKLTGLPKGLVERTLNDLVQARIVSRIEGDGNGEPAFQPARDIQALSISAVLEALDHQGIESLPLAEDEKLSALAEAMRHYNACAADSPGNRLLRDI
jgi:membrane protein